MTAIVGPDTDVLIASRDDLKTAIANALRRADCTFDELAEQARTDNYNSARARLAWMSIGDLYRVNL